MEKRELKFRAWHKEYKKMIYQEHGICNFFGDTSPVSDYGDDEISEECEIMQFTGLKDKEGNEIYEGDIIEFADHLHKAVVVYDKKFAAYLFESNNLEKKNNPDTAMHWHDDLKIIGNIYENPELIDK